jgi:hypothetical protein
MQDLSIVQLQTTCAAVFGVKSSHEQQYCWRAGCGAAEAMDCRCCLEQLLYLLLMSKATTTSDRLLLISTTSAASIATSVPVPTPQTALDGQMSAYALTIHEASGRA